MVFYLIGPSGVGKSTLAREATIQIPYSIHFELDELSRGEQFNWDNCRPVLTQLDRQYALTNEIAFVEIGAGTQTLTPLAGFIKPRKINTLLLIATSYEVFWRNPLGPQRSYTEFRKTEYESRQSLYNLAGHKIDISGRNPIQALDHFMKFLGNTFSIREGSRNLAVERYDG